MLLVREFFLIEILTFVIEDLIKLTRSIILKILTQSLHHPPTHKIPCKTNKNEEDKKLLYHSIMAWWYGPIFFVILIFMEEG